MRNFTLSIIKILLIILLVSITLPTLADTLGPRSGATYTAAKIDSGFRRLLVVNPDNPLYSVQRSIEGLQLGFSVKHRVKAQLLVNFAQARLAEAATMLDNNKPALAIRSVSELITELQTLEEIKDYLPTEVQSNLDLAIFTLQTDSAPIVARVLKISEEGQEFTDNSDLKKIRQFVKANPPLQAAIEQSNRAKN